MVLDVVEGTALSALKQTGEWHLAVTVFDALVSRDGCQDRDHRSYEATVRTVACAGEMERVLG